MIEFDWELRVRLYQPIGHGEEKVRAYNYRFPPHELEQLRLPEKPLNPFDFMEYRMAMDKRQKAIDRIAMTIASSLARALDEQLK